MFYYLNVEKSKRSLLIRNEIIEKLDKELGVDIGFSYNDLYGVKGGVVRRLKGSIWSEEMWGRGEYGNNEIFNEFFNKVKEFVENLEFEGFEIKLNKKLDYGWYEYRRWKENGSFEGNFNDYKKWRLDNERDIILKIKWNR